MKTFNTTGLCLPDQHYMCDVSAKFARCKELVENGSYYAINFPRQHGKTTMKALLAKAFRERDDYLVISTSMEGMGDDAFESEQQLCYQFMNLIAEEFEYSDSKTSEYFSAEAKKIADYQSLQRFISRWIAGLKKKVILLVDEIDKASNSQVFISFLASLRDRYLQSKEKNTPAFHSVVLLGVHDVKTLKLKLRPNEEKKLNSPWNIAEDLDLDFAFSRQEIEHMLKEYADDHRHKSPVIPLATRIYYYSSGNPFLISQMCKLVDKWTSEHTVAWTVEDIDKAYKYLIDGNYTTTNFDDIDKNLENNQDLFNVVHNIVIQGEGHRFTLSDPTIAKGKTYGILKQNEKGLCDVSNKVYEFRIVDYMLSKCKTQEAQLNLYTNNEFKSNNKLNLGLILEKFQLFMQEHHSSKDNAFLEKNGRLLLMSFLRPIINGQGYMFKENVTSEDRKMDLVITYDNQRYVIELKIWYGEKYISDGIEQLCDYLDSYALDEGFMLIYNFNKNKKYEIVQVPDCRKNITAVFV